MQTTGATIKARATRAGPIILGIDPGYDRLGYAVLKGTLTKPELVTVGCVSPKGSSHHERLQSVAQAIHELTQTYHPTKASVEQLFFSKNVKTAIKVAEARGVIISELARAGLAIQEPSPQAVKIAATGQGNADKKQVEKMLCLIFKLKTAPKPADAADALAIALTGLIG